MFEYALIISFYMYVFHYLDFCLLSLLNNTHHSIVKVNGRLDSICRTLLTRIDRKRPNIWVNWVTTIMQHFKAEMNY